MRRSTRNIRWLSVLGGILLGGCVLIQYVPFKEPQSGPTATLNLTWGEDSHPPYVYICNDSTGLLESVNKFVSGLDSNSSIKIPAERTVYLDAAQTIGGGAMQYSCGIRVGFKPSDQASYVFNWRWPTTGGGCSASVYRAADAVSGQPAIPEPTAFRVTDRDEYRKCKMRGSF